VTQEAVEVDVEALFEEEFSEGTSPDTSPDTSAVSLDPEPVAPDHVQHLALSGQITLEQRIAELEAALQNSVQEWEPDGSEEELTDETRPLSIGKDARLADAIASVAQTLEDTLEQNPPEPEERWQPSTDSKGPTPIDSLYSDSPIPTVSEEDSNLEDDDTVEWQDVEQELEPDFSRETEVGLEAAVQEEEADHNIAAMTAAMQAASQDLAQEAVDEDRDTDLFAMDEPTTLDEEALQEMVADIVRQELQGVLGERITRNVRRLVRREIKRALAMRDLE
jgi:hypothetical protein